MSHRNRLAKALMVLGAGVLFAAGTVMAQSVTTASFSGVVKDNNGQPVYGANVIATHVPSGTVFGAATRNDGRYNIPFVRVGGPYSLTVNFIGYKKETRDGIMLTLSENKAVNFTMVEEAVELEGVEIVVERNPIISESRTGAATTVSSVEIEKLPTIERSFNDFTRLSPHFSGSNAAGRNNRYNTIQIDGAVNNDIFGLGEIGTPGGQARTQPISLDAIQEFQVVIAPYDVRMGGFTGGGINAISRSGTNKYEGSVYHYFRNESFVGTYENADPYSSLSERTTGFRFGGPILKDRLFFFLNGEISSQNTESSFGLLGTGKENDFTGISKVDADRVIAILDTVWKYKAGSSGIQTLKRPNTKIFARLDYNLSDKHRLTFRHNYVDATRDLLSQSLSSTSPNSGFRLSDAGYKFFNTTNSTVLQLTSAFSNQMSNELIIGYTSIRDKRDIKSSKPFPAINVRIGSNTLIAGSENFSQANSLDQDIIEITNNFNYFLGDHTFTVGTHNEFFSFKNVFIRDYFGNYTFDNIDSLMVGRPSSYSLSYSLDTNNLRPSAKFGVNQIGFYIQDAWRVKPNFVVTAGLRFDIPYLPDKPSYNPTVDTTQWAYGLNLNTNEVPSGNLLFSPRLGFNWDVKDDKTLQIRGGVGVFSGRTPYVWISNQYGNTGVDVGRISLSGGGISGRIFTPDVNNQPGRVYTAPQSEVDVTDPDFKLPQVIRLNIGFDHQLGYGVTGSFDFLYSKNKNDIMYQNVNLKGVSGYLQLSNSGNPNGLRPRYTTTPTGTSTNVISSRFGGSSNGVIYLSNTDLGHEYNVSGQLTKTFNTGFFGSVDKGFFANVAYTYGRAFDVNSGTSSQAISNWRFNPVKGDPNEAVLSTSNYETRHRVIGSISYNFEFISEYTTTLSVFYSGYSGSPYSTTYDGDVNGDGQGSNDLIYVPRDINDINIVPQTASGSLPADTRTVQQIWEAMDRYIAGDPALNRARGKIVNRNASSTPWSNRVDLRFAQEIPVSEKWGKFELTADVLNFLNALKRSWGLTEFVANQNNSHIVYRGIISGAPAFTFGKYNYLTQEYETPKRTQVSDLASRWQLQLGIRYTF